MTVSGLRGRLVKTKSDLFGKVEIGEDVMGKIWVPCEGERGLEEMVWPQYVAAYEFN